VNVADFAVPGPLTKLSPQQASMVLQLDPEPRTLCLAAQGLLVSPSAAVAAGVSSDRMAERNIRSAQAILQRSFELDGITPLVARRPTEHRVVGTCRHFAVVSTAFMRARGIPARARCGFAGYFDPPRKVDHWIVEHWSTEASRWIRLDSEYLDLSTPSPARLEDLQPWEFLTAGEAWQLIRSGGSDPGEFGVFGTGNWGPGEVRGNAMRDLASVAAKVEMLPWDEWGPMAASYRDESGEEFDALIDQVAGALQVDDLAAAERLYARLLVPSSMIT